LPINTKTKAVSTDCPFGLLAACPIFNIEMSYGEVDYWANACLNINFNFCLTSLFFL